MNFILQRTTQAVANKKVRAVMLTVALVAALTASDQTDGSPASAQEEPTVASWYCTDF